MGRNKNRSRIREEPLPPSEPVMQPSPPYSRRTHLWLLVISAAAWLAGVGFLVAMTVLRFRTDPM